MRLFRRVGAGWTSLAGPAGLLISISINVWPSMTAGLLLGAVLPAGAQPGMPSGKQVVDPKLMASYCLTKVSPMYPHIPQLPGPVTVVLQVVITSAGAVEPMQVISGPRSFQDAARSAVRLWRYRSFISNNTPVDVVTNISMDFVPGTPGGMITHPSH